MKTEKNILVAFVLNLLFSVFEFIGGAFTGSVAIISDAIHDMGDAVSIGFSYFLEKTSKRPPDSAYTYGYARYSVMGSVVTTVILLLGSVAVIYNAVLRIFNPVTLNYDGMIIFALVGVTVNFVAARVTKDGDSLNQKAVNLHMLEDVLGWAVVLAGAVIMKFTDITVLDSLMSLAIAVFIIINAYANLKKSLDLFLEKSPDELDAESIKAQVCVIDGVSEVHHLHLWSIDGYNNFATMHVVTDENEIEIKKEIKSVLKKCGISHATLELEKSTEVCNERNCSMEKVCSAHHSHHHHHHHHHHH